MSLLILGGHLQVIFYIFELVQYLREFGMLFDFQISLERIEFIEKHIGSLLVVHLLGEGITRDERDVLRAHWA